LDPTDVGFLDPTDVHPRWMLLHGDRLRVITSVVIQERLRHLNTSRNQDQGERIL